MNQKSHPTLEEIALEVLDSRPEASVVREHLEEGCALCNRLAEELRVLAEGLPRVLAGDPSPELLRRCAELLPDPSTEEIRELVAELIEDTRELAGVRGEAAAGRHVLLRAGEFEIDLRIRRLGTRARTEIRGQIHGPDARSGEGMRVRALRGDRVVVEGRTDAHGEFKMIAAGAGSLRLEMDRARTRIRTPDLSA